MTNETEASPTLVSDLKEQIRKLGEEIINIQKLCQHPPETVAVSYSSNTGNYDPSADRYWKKFICELCEKKWTEEQ